MLLSAAVRFFLHGESTGGHWPTRQSFTVTSYIHSPESGGKNRTTAALPQSALLPVLAA